MPKLPSLRGRVVLVTGAARGIGLATAHAFARAGAQVVLTDIDHAAVTRAAEGVSRIAPARAAALDVTDRAAFADVVAGVEKEIGSLDVLVNNAGIMAVGPFLSETERVTDRQLDINVKGVINGMQAALPAMLRRRAGHVVNIASVAGRIATPNIAVYSATKHAVVGLTEAVRREHLDAGVRFSYVLPSLVDTELISGTGRPAYPPVATPEQVAQAVLHAVRTGRVDLYVPRFSTLSRFLPALLPRRVYERVGQALGLDEMFAQVDPDGRAAYNRRALD